MSRSGRHAPSEVGDRGDLEPGPGAGRRPFVAAREPAPTTELGEGVLDPVQRCDRDEARGPGWRPLEVKRELLASGDRGEAAVCAVAADRPQARQFVDPFPQELAGACTSCGRAESARVTDLNAASRRNRGTQGPYVGSPCNNQRFVDQVDPERRLPERERLRRADAARRAYFTRLAYLSARKRRGAGR